MTVRYDLHEQEFAPLSDQVTRIALCLGPGLLSLLVEDTELRHCATKIFRGLADDQAGSDEG